MTISISTPTSNTGSIQNNSTDVLTIGSDNSVSVINNLSSTSLSVNTDTLYVDATNNNVGIGTSSPSTKFNVSGGNILVDRGGTTSGLTRSITIGGARNGNGNAYASLNFQNYDSDNSAADYVGASIHAEIDDASTDGGKLVFSTTNGTTVSERLRINANGEIYMGTTNSVHNNSCTLHVELNESAGSVMATQRNLTTGARHLTFYNPNGEVGSIQTAGTTTSYTETSDYRLKENVAPMSGSIDKLKQLKPSTWLWKIDGSYGEGFLAHEAQAVVPIAVTGTKDEVDDEGNPEYQGIDKSKLVPLLTAALQEAITKIEDLETRIQTLENN